MAQQMNDMLGYWVKRTYRNICHFLDTRLAPYGLTNSQLGVLLLLWETDGLTQTQVQQALGIQPASLTHLIKGLEQKKLIHRKMDATDSRLKRLFLTAEAEPLKEPCLAIVKAGEQQMQHGFAPEEIALMTMWMKRFKENLDEH